MANELVAQKTPVTKEDMLRALWDAWHQIFGTLPKKESIWVLASQWALETGWGKSMWCYNIGNVKSREGDGHDYCYFACNEILKRAQADAYVAKDPSTAKVTQYRADGTAIIWFYPKHPGCRFRAFNSLLEGCIDYLTLLHKRFSRSWPAVLAGDPGQFSHLLRQQGYYTADEATYTKTLVSVFGTVSKVKVDYESVPTISEAERDRIAGLVALTMQQSLDDVVSGISDEPEPALIA